MLKLGIVGFDTSHVAAFSKRLNKKGIEADQFVDGAEVVLGCPGTSLMSPERMPGFIKTVTEECGVKLVDTPEAMLGKVDGILIETEEGGLHLERARPFLEEGVSTWIDKPLACSTRDAESIIHLAEKKNTPLFSASSLRYAPEIVDVLNSREELGAPVAVDVYGAQLKKPRNPGWFNYGIHSVEMLIALLGPGFKEVTYVAAGTTEHAASVWDGDAVGSVTLAAKGEGAFGFTYIGEKKTRSARVNGSVIYRELLKQMVGFFTTGKAPVTPSETLSIIRFIEAVNRAGAACCGGHDRR
jgi:predicted dehydrogenase